MSKNSLRMLSIQNTECNICKIRLTGGQEGFIRHGEEFHPNYYLNGRNDFLEKNYYCPLTGLYYYDRKHMAGVVNRLGFSDEQYYLKFGQEFMPREWLKNTTDPVTSDMRNKPECGQCNKMVKFGMWAYRAFCGFSCATKWYANNTDRVKRAMATNELRKEENPDHNLQPSQLRYWILKGYSESEAKAAQKIRQTTFNKEICFQKYGEEAGLERWLLRQERWLDGLKKSGIYVGVSKISMEIFSSLATEFDSIQYGKNEYRIRVGNRVSKVDCYDSRTNRIIEFHGDYWHANPLIYNETHMIKGKKDFMSAYDKWEFDAHRVKSLENLGYEVLVIWENQFRKTPEIALQKCREFLSGNIRPIDPDSLFIW